MHAGIYNHDLTQAELKRVLDYDPDTGVFTWKVRTSRRTHVGDVAGGLDRSSGYRRITIAWHSYLAHRLAWLYVYGRLPCNQIDHRNEIRDDNRLSNLREATIAQNKRNQGKLENNKSGYKGVSRTTLNNKFTAHCSVDGKPHYLGSFTDPESAHETYCRFAKRHHKEFFHK